MPGGREIKSNTDKAFDLLQLLYHYLQSVDNIIFVTLIFSIVLLLCLLLFKSQQYWKRRKKTR